MFPQFSRPERPVSFARRNSFVAFLDQRQVPYREWGEKTFKKRWKEVRRRDALITTGEEYAERDVILPPNCIVRHIRTATVRITHETARDANERRGLLRKEVLSEYEVREDGSLEPRPYSHSSLSEKLHWSKSMSCDEHPASGLMRAFLEELGIQVYKNELTSGRLFRIPPDIAYLRGSGKGSGFDDVYMQLQFQQLVQEHRALGIDLDVYWSDPGIITLNQLVHYIWRMPDRHYRPQGYVDPGTRYVSRWRSAEEST